jgi:hypothetical protein
LPGPSGPLLLATPGAFPWIEEKSRTKDDDDDD